MRHRRRSWLAGCVMVAAVAGACERLSETLVIRSFGKAGLGDYEGAEADATRAIGRDPKSAWAWGHRGYCRRRRNGQSSGHRGLCRARRVCRLG